MRAVAVKNIDIERLGTFRELLEKRGIEVEEVEAKKGIDIPVNSFDVLIILGGPMGVYQKEEFPFLEEEEELIRQFHGQGKRVLGICLGAQLIASAFGASVYRGKWGKEIGWDFIYPQNHFEFLYQGEIEVFHWHGDTFDLPKGAVRLASSVKYRNQAFRLGRTVGLQFHLEVTRPDIECWIEAYREELREEGISPDQILSDDEKWNRLKLYADVFINYFLKL